MTTAIIFTILTILTFPDLGSTKGISTNMANFLSVFTGYVDNLEQHRADPTSHDFIQLLTVPVVTAAFHGVPVIYNEYSFNSKLLNRLLCVPSENCNGIIRLTLYNFTDTTEYMPGEYNIEKLSHLTLADLQAPCSYEAVFQPDGPGAFVGTWPDSRHSFDGKPILYAATRTCMDMKLVIPRSANEMSSELLYHLFLKGDRYSVPNLPKYFVSPCH